MSSPEFRQRIDFPSDSQPIAEEQLQGAQQFSEEFVDPLFVESSPIVAEASKAELGLEQAIAPASSLWQKLLIIGVLILLISSSAQLVQTWLVAWQQQAWFTLGLCLAGSLMAVAALGSLCGELYRLYRLSYQKTLRAEALQLLHSNGTGNKARKFCEKLLQRSSIDPQHKIIEQWYQAQDQSQSDKEVMQLYCQLIQPLIDQQARKLIIENATHSALMVAASPLALVDMALVAWRSVRLINQIARLYHVEPGYLGRLRLFRAVLVNMAFTGASEWLQESSAEWLSQDLAVRLSGRIAQGLGVGLLTARLGIKTMTLCRPVPWLADQGPKVADFRVPIIKQIRQLFKKGSA